MIAAWNLIPDFLKKWVAIGIVLIAIGGAFGIWRGVSCLGHKATEGGTSEKIQHSNVPGDVEFDTRKLQEHGK